MELPVVPSCSLDGDGLSRQRERFRRAGIGASILERTPRRIVVRIAPSGAAVVPALVEVESECCSFFGLDWNPDEMLLSVSVGDGQHEPALDAITDALGVG